MKRLLGLLVVILIANMGQIFATDCTVGEKRPSGGYIFFCDDINPKKKVLPDGKVGLEAAVSDVSIRATWYNGENKITGASKTEVGKGMGNTKTIVASQGVSKGNASYGAVAYAAMLCYELNTFTDSHRDADADWFLPSKDELNLIHKELFLNGKGDLTASRYWSSSEDEDNRAFAQYFLKDSSHDGSQPPFFKEHNDLAVRCARAF
jgi:hypothetical protein